MQDHLSRLPAPLPLYILLQLPDLKALYAAVLSSPCLYAAFRLNACRVLDSITQRMPDELKNLIYMHLLLQNRSYTESITDSTQGFQNQLNTTDLVPAGRDGHSAATVFRAITQAVRLSDIGYIILRSKLDYYMTLQPEKLANRQFRYTRDLVTRQDPEGIALSLANNLQDPSWVEEGRVLWVLWLICIARLLSCRVAACSYENALDHLVQSQLRFGPLDHRWTDDVLFEITECLVTGTNLQPPTCSRSSLLHGLAALQPYEIPSPPYLTATSGSKRAFSTSPMFSWSPAGSSASSLNSVVWHIRDPELLHENPTARYIRAMRNGPDSPIQTSDRGVFNRLGFGFWDRRRVSADFHLLMNVQGRAQLEADPALHPLDGPHYISRSDGLFRLLSIYKQDKGREENGWQRGFQSSSES